MEVQVTRKWLIGNKRDIGVGLSRKSNRLVSGMEAEYWTMNSWIKQIMNILPFFSYLEQVATICRLEQPWVLPGKEMWLTWQKILNLEKRLIPFLRKILLYLPLWRFLPECALRVRILISSNLEINTNMRGTDFARALVEWVLTLSRPRGSRLTSKIVWR